MVNKEKRTRIDEIFDINHQKLIINRFYEAGIFYLDEITVPRLDKVYALPGIGIGKRQFIENRLRELTDIINRPLDVSSHAEEVSKIGSSKLILPLLPFSDWMYKRHFFSKNRFFIWREEYLRALNYLFENNKFRKLNSKLKNNLEHFQKVNRNELQILNNPNIDILIKASQIFLNCNSRFKNSEYSLLNTWALVTQLFPSTIQHNINNFLDSLGKRDRYIFENRRMKYHAVTLESLGQRCSITRERVRQIDKRTALQFSQWWQDNKLTFQLLVLTKCKRVMIQDYFSSRNSLLITNTILEKDEILKKYLTTDASYYDLVERDLSEFLADKKIHEFSELVKILKNNKIEIREKELDNILKKQNYQIDHKKNIIYSIKRLTKLEIINDFCLDFNTKIIRFEDFNRLNEWSKKKLGYVAFQNYHLFKVTLINKVEYIPIGKGHYKLFDENNYDLSIFKKANTLLRAHFSDGCCYVRDVWIFDKFKKELPNTMTSDEFYQVFQRLYPYDFVYSTGRNNDIFVAGSQPLTIGEQITNFLKHRKGSVSLSYLKKQFGWASYTIQQEAKKNRELGIDGQNIIWIDIDLVKKEAGKGLSKFINESLDHNQMITIVDVFKYYVKNFNSLAVRTHTNSKSSMVNIVKNLDLDIDVVSDFIFKRGDFAKIKRTSADFWAKYLSLKVTDKASLKDLKELALNAGIKENTWNQVNLKYIRKSDLLPISSNYFANKNKINRSLENDKIVDAKLQKLFAGQKFVAVNLLNEVFFLGLPDVGLPWTPELFGSYASLLGYKTYSWPLRMFRTPCYVIVAGDTTYRGIEEIAAQKIRELMKINSKEKVLYNQLSVMGLVPKRIKVGNRRFPREFYSAERFYLNSLGNVVDLN